ncbi:helix-turn-helix transcriptional regulator [Pararhodobacter zhoushanensis]|uniref:helix-turn-helix transcriptional regulator n=1 Tax=Pararhodobacter zhoushanensis TaxID=2479545 RepID=UPI000F8F182B|nr:hypothetical protein [Pararhodobacter zhoushanensis]
MLGRSLDVETLRLLYSCAAQPAETAPPWGAFLDALIALTRAHAAHLRIAAGSDTLTYSTDPTATVPPLEGLRTDRVYGQGEIAGATTPLRALRVSPRGDVQVWLVITTTRPEFDAIDGVKLSNLAPHLAQAVETWLALAGERARAHQSARAAQDLGAGWLWLDATARISASDDGARALIAASPALRLTLDNRLDFRDATLARDLRRRIDKALLPDADPQILTLERAPLLQLSLLPGLSPRAPGLEPTLRALLRLAPSARHLAQPALGAAFDLKPSETRLAALLCDGLSLAECAARLGWTIETTRSCSKSLFARTGTRSQSDLIRRMLNSAVWFSPD